jgi:hypothetical protein
MMPDFDPAKHPREPGGSSIGGRFTAAPGSGGAAKYGHSLSIAAKSTREHGGRPVTRGALLQLFEQVATSDGGFTYSPVTDTSPKSGFAVSIYPERSAAFDLANLRFSDLVNYYASNRDLIRRDGHYLGAWHDPKSHKIFFDVSVVRHTLGAARGDAIAKDQIAVFDLSKMKSIVVNPSAKSGGVV